MRSLSPALASHFASGHTTLCWCWRLTRRDNVTVGFTDHDRDLFLDGTTFEAAAGFTASEITDSLGFTVDDLDVESALSSDRLDEAGLAAGLFDDARVEIFRVNWADPSQYVLMRAGSIGEVRRSGSHFTAEVRGLSHYLQQPQGRLYQYTCDADLGDARCGIDLTTPAWQANATIAEVTSATNLGLADLSDYTSGWFDRGLCQVADGPASGQRVEIKSHTIRDGLHRIELWHPLVILPEAGDAMTLTAGCDKTLSICANRFANAANFRGFPHMPGNDFIIQVARPGSPGYDGRSRSKLF